MKALVFEEGLRLVRDHPEPAAGPDEAVIEVRLAGVCGTDLEITQGYKGFRGVLGHEFVGEVVSAPDPAWIGRRVCAEINIHCGDCDLCRAGLFTHCRRRSVIGILGRDGAFAERIAVPVENLHAVPQTLSDEEAVFVEPLAAAFEILEQVEIGAGQRVVVLGDGRLGSLCAQVLSGTGAKLTVVGKHDHKLRLLRDMGIDARAGGGSPAAADVVVEATGSAEGFRYGLRLLRPRGTLILKSTYAATASIDMSPVVVNEVTVLGSRCGPFVPALDALARGAVRVRPLIQEIVPLDDGMRAMAVAARPGALKILLQPKE